MKKIIDMIRWNIYIFGWTRYNSIETKRLFCWILIFMRKMFMKNLEVLFTENRIVICIRGRQHVKGRCCFWWSERLCMMCEWVRLCTKGRWLAGEMEAAIKRCFVSTKVCLLLISCWLSLLKIFWTNWRERESVNQSKNVHFLLDLSADSETKGSCLNWDVERKKIQKVNKLSRKKKIVKYWKFENCLNVYMVPKHL